MKHRVEDFPFRIRDVQELMGLRPVRSHAEDGDFNCIFCGGKAKMNINYLLFILQKMKFLNVIIKILLIL